MQYIELSVKERQEIKHLRTWVSYFSTSKKYVLCLSYKICLTNNCPSRYEIFHVHRRSKSYCGFVWARTDVPGEHCLSTDGNVYCYLEIG